MLAHLVNMLGGLLSMSGTLRTLLLLAALGRSGRLAPIPPRTRSMSLATFCNMAKKKGLYANINAKRKRIKAGSGETMRKPGSKGAPTAKAFKQSKKTAKKR